MNAPLPRLSKGPVGKRTPLVDGIEKVTGKALYTADIARTDALVGRILRSPIAHIRALAAEAGRITLAGHAPAPEGVEQRHACIDNPLCGDQIEARIQVRDGRIIDLGFEIRGCLLLPFLAIQVAR